MNILAGTVLAVVVVAITVGGILYRRKVLDKTYNEFVEPAESFTLVVTQNDSGRNLKSIIVNTGDLSSLLGDKDFSPDKAKVEYDGKKITVTKLTPCDIDGNPEEDLQFASHILLETEPTEVKAFEKSECPVTVSLIPLKDVAFTYFDTLVLAD